jgi:uncharacterized protein YbjQ (UPF0145 family)
MTPSDILTLENIQGFQIMAYLGVVDGKGSSSDAVFETIVEKAEVLGANKVIGFHLQAPTTRRFYGYGTAVSVAPV